MDEKNLRNEFRYAGHPVSAMVDGTTKTVATGRGDKQVLRKLVDIYLQQRAEPESLAMVVDAAVDEHGDNLAALLKEETGRDLPRYKAGASIVINAGPNIVAVVLLGKKRS
mgnify:CR=1 FL=1